MFLAPDKEALIHAIMSHPEMNYMDMEAKIEIGSVVTEMNIRTLQETLEELNDNCMRRDLS